MTRKTPDWNKIRTICEDMELKSILRELPEGNSEPDLFADISRPGEAKNKIKKEPEKFAPDLFADN